MSYSIYNIASQKYEVRARGEGGREGKRDGGREGGREGGCDGDVVSSMCMHVYVCM